MSDREAFESHEQSRNSTEWDDPAVTDSSTSPVPPKEIEEVGYRVEVAMNELQESIEYWVAADEYVGDNPPSPDDVTELWHRVSRSRQRLREAIASYTLSPEEAQDILERIRPKWVRNSEAPDLIKLRRIAASTEEASQ